MADPPAAPAVASTPVISDDEFEALMSAGSPHPASFVSPNSLLAEFDPVLSSSPAPSLADPSLTTSIDMAGSPPPEPSSMAGTDAAQPSGASSQDHQQQQQQQQHAAHEGDAGKFSFQRFKEQLHLPEAAALRVHIERFVKEFRAKGKSVQQGADLFQDFLIRMDDVILSCGLWETDVEVENAREGLEKQVTHRIFAQVFAQPSTDDVSRDEILRHRTQLFNWVSERHLDIEPHPANHDQFKEASTELLKINKYRSPRDKFICLLNCVKVLNRLLKRTGVLSNADSFLPMLIFTLIHSNVPHLVSNIQYIARFRGASRLRSEAEYYFTLVVSAVAFLETMDARSLNIPADEFDRLMEQRMREMETQPPATPLPAPYEEDADQDKSDKSPEKLAKSAEKSVEKSAEKSGEKSGADEPTSAAKSPAKAATPKAAADPKAAQSVQSDAKSEKAGGLLWNMARAVLSSPDTRQAKVPPAQQQEDEAKAGKEEAKAVKNEPKIAKEDAAVKSMPAEYASLMSTTDQALLEDYDLQLAMALSLSIKDAAETMRVDMDGAVGGDVMGGEE